MNKIVLQNLNRKATVFNLAVDLGKFAIGTRQIGKHPAKTGNNQQTDCHRHHQLDQGKARCSQCHTSMAVEGGGLDCHDGGHAI